LGEKIHFGDDFRRDRAGRLKSGNLNDIHGISPALKTDC
jgi:hypothetical protein